MMEGGGRRVVQVAVRAFPYTGGVETHVSEVASRLGERGFDVTVLSTDPSGKLPRQEHVGALTLRRVRSWPPNYDLYFAPSIYRELVTGTWDLVHIQGYHTLVAPLAMVAARRTNTPYVLTLHSGGHTSPVRILSRTLQWAVLRPLFKRAEKIVAVSEFEAAYFSKRLRIRRDHFLVIPNGSHLPPVVGDPPRGDAPLLLSIGRLERYKGHHRVVAAMPRVLAKYPGARLHILGSGPYQAELERLIGELSLSGSVNIDEIRDRAEMARIIAGADVVALLSDYESQGIAVMEALALGRPVLVADTTALHDLVARGLVRGVERDADTEAITMALLRQIEDPVRPVGVDMPTWEACASQVAALYKTILGEHLCAS